MHLTFIGSGDAFASGGRVNTCLKLEAGGETLLIDLGASAMLELVRREEDRNAVRTILFTHFHGDHFAGLPFFLLDACFVSKRQQALTIAGPKGVEARVLALTEMLYPGVMARHAKFPLRFVEVSPGAPQPLGGVTAEAFPMVHDEAAGPCQGYRLSYGGRTLAFTGDTSWTEALIPLAKDADLLVSECCFVDLVIPNHLCLKQLEAARAQLACRRMILTHMGPEMLAHAAPSFAEKAHDGLRVEV